MMTASKRKTAPQSNAQAISATDRLIGIASRPGTWLVLPGWLALAALILLPAAILPIFGRISAGQTFAFEFVGTLVLGPVVLISIAWLALTGRAPGMSRRYTGDRGFVTFHMLDAAMLAYFAANLFAWLFSPWHATASLIFPAAFGAFYVGWRLGIGGQGTVLPPSLVAAVTVSSFAVSAHALMAGLGYNPLYLLNRGLEESQQRGSLFTLLGHPNYFGSAVAVWFYMKLDALIRGRQSSVTRAALIASLIIDVVALFAIGARGATLAVLVGGVYATFATLAHREVSARLRMGLAVGLLAGLLVLAIAGRSALSEARQSVRGPAGRATLAERMFSRREVTTRLESWLVAAGLALERPLVGVGPGAFNSAYWDFLRRQIDEIDRKRSPMARAIDPFLLDAVAGLSPGNAHNEALHTFAETGILGLVALALALAAALVRAHRGGAPLLAAALVSTAVDAQFNFPLHLPVSVAMISLLLAVVAEGTSIDPEDHRLVTNGAGGQLATGVSRVGFLALGLFLLLGCIQGAFRLRGEFRARQVARDAALVTTPGDALMRLRQAADLDPSNFDIRRDVIRLLTLTGDTKEALAEADRLVRDSSHPHDLARLAEAMIAPGALPKITSNNLDDARRTYGTALTLSPRYQLAAERRLAIGLQLYGAGESQAVRTYETARVLDAINDLERIDPHHPLLAYAEGVLSSHEAGGSPLAAIRHLRRADQQARERLARGADPTLSALLPMIARDIALLASKAPSPQAPSSSDPTVAPEEPLPPAEPTMDDPVPPPPASPYR